MRTRLCLCLVATWLLSPAFVAQAADNTHEGKVVSVEQGTGGSDGKLVMTDKDGNSEHTHMIPSNAKITRDSRNVKLSELKKGDFIKVTKNSDGKISEISAMQRGADRFGSSGDSGMPNFLTSLNLTTEQKDKIKGICHECDSDREAAWKEFGQCYREAVGIEASMLAAIEDHLTDTQRKHVRHHRHHLSHDQDGSVSNSGNQSSTSQSTKDSSKNSSNNTANSNNNAAKGNDKNGVAVEEITVIGITLSPEQEAAAEGIRTNYFDRLRKLNGEMQELHGRLVAMETERLLKIEEVLTKEQRQQLRKEHQKLNPSQKQASRTDSSSN